MHMKNWIYTDGAPFICATPSIRELWRGVWGSSTGVIASDYDRVCEEVGYLSTIDCGTSQVLVLGEEPAQATFLLIPNGAMIVRWIACESMELADSALKRIPSALPYLQPAIRFKVDEPELWMFDSSSDGSKAIGAASVTDVSPGEFEVTTERYSEGVRFEFWIHRFIPIAAGDLNSQSQRARD